MRQVGSTQSTTTLLATAVAPAVAGEICWDGSGDGASGYETLAGNVEDQKEPDFVLESADASPQGGPALRSLL